MRSAGRLLGELPPDDISVVTLLPPASPPQFEKVPGNEVTPLSTEDTWLTNLGGQPDDSLWLQRAKLLAVVGSIDLNTVRQPELAKIVISARQKFYGELLGWDNPEAALHKNYQSLKQERPYLVAVNKMIGAQRVMAERAVDGSKVLKTCFNVILMDPLTLETKLQNFASRNLDAAKIVEPNGNNAWLDTDTVNERIDNLEESGVSSVKVLQGYDRGLTIPPATVRKRIDELVAQVGPIGFAIIETFPSLVGNDVARTAERLQNLFHLQHRFGWQGDMLELLRKAPVLLGISDAKLFTHAGLLIKFGDPAMTESTIGSLVMTPLESHIVAVHNGVRGSDYKRSSILKAVNGLKPSDRREQAALALQDPAFRRRLGRKTVEWYKTYTALYAVR